MKRGSWSAVEGIQCNRHLCSSACSEGWSDDIQRGVASKRGGCAGLDQTKCKWSNKNRRVGTEREMRPCFTGFFPNLWRSFLWRDVMSETLVLSLLCAIDKYICLCTAVDVHATLSRHRFLIWMHGASRASISLCLNWVQNQLISPHNNWVQGLHLGSVFSVVN